MARDNGKLLDAKRRLYAALLEIDRDEIEDGEIDLMFSLAQDKQIQEFLNRFFPKKGGQ